MRSEDTAVVVVDVTGRITRWDAVATRLFGHHAEVVLGRDVALLVPPEHRDAHRRGFDAVMAGRPGRLVGVATHLPVCCTGGSVAAFPARLDLLRAPDGTPVGAVATFEAPRADAAPFTPLSGRWPTVRRIVANLAVTDPALDRDFWTGVLGLETAMDLGWVVNHRDGAHQVQLISRDATAPEDSRVSVEVGDVDAVHAAAVAAGFEIVHPLTDEPWGVRRFFVRTPGGVVVNVLAHR